MLPPMAPRPMALRVHQKQRSIADSIVIVMNVVSLVLLLLLIVLLMSVISCSNGPVAWYQHAAPNYLGHAPALRPSAQHIASIVLSLFSMPMQKPASIFMVRLKVSRGVWAWPGDVPF